MERKCRLLFGTCLLPLIAGSFWWSANLMNQIVEDRTSFTGEALAKSVLVEAHFKKQEADEAMQRADERTAEMLRSANVKWQILRPKNEQGLGSPEEQFEWDLLDRWEDIGKNLKSDAEIEDLGPQWYQRLVKAKEYDSVVVEQEGTQPDIGNKNRWIYQYYEPVFAKEGCILCHSSPGMEVYWPDLRVGDLLAVVRIETDAAEIKKAQQNIIAWLIVAAIVTVFLAMMALYAIVRYIIVKPLRHLRDVSDAVRSGDIDQRAVIHTGDEFEELGAAFNRMLRQLLRQQDELREVNTELDEKIDEMAEANMRLFEMNQVKSDFLATVSHELRTPLNSIIGFSDLLVSLEKLEDKEKRYAGNIQRSGRQLLEMINDILDLAKIESGKMEIRPSEFSIGSIVANQCDMARPLSEKKHIELDCQVEPGLPHMRQDCSKVEQIINNLLSNAIKFTPDGGRITVSVRRDRRDELRMSVADTGVGISDSEQTIIFEKFRQGSNVLAGGTAMTREYSGTGLGLSIVRELCRLLGGEITVESELGKGSEFTVVLPWTIDDGSRSFSTIGDELRELARPRVEATANK
ncbi:sensor histidine kinase [Bythopirellula polymerisocia]|uniref:sensor histidine kinase n=1 Tax=Bythopirellula polymerisocia TaxID=2528003 RepID=UPI0018D366C5|nr:HAMP domain-containing sensor histidine kinase [Bythopirellula polymerisocia]